MCDVLEVSRSGYYRWCGRPESARQKEDKRLGDKIEEAFEQSRQTAGTRRLRLALRRNGDMVSRSRTRRLMQQRELKVSKGRRWVPRTTDSSRTTRIAPNLLNRDFSSAEPNRKWSGDITYVSTSEGWLYLAVVLELHSRMIVGWSMSKSMDAALVTDAMEMALQKRRPAGGLIFHSDRGSQYASHGFLQLLAAWGVEPSMSRKGNCWDNAVTESLFSTIKRELIAKEQYASYREAEASIFEYIEVYYNRTRQHSRLGGHSPHEFETEHCALLSS